LASAAGNYNSVMLSEQKLLLTARLDAAVNTVAGGAATALPVVTLERPKIAAHGDIACNIALQLAKPLGKNPREVAQAIVALLQADPLAAGLIDAAEIAGPGFINFRLTAQARRAVVGQVFLQGESFGRNLSGAGNQVMIEFVSANPTGPLHVGHARQGALGDGLANLFGANGWAVQREFYYNDAGQQINNLAASVYARLHGIDPTDSRFPEAGYRGEYIADIAADFLARRSVGSADVAPVTASGDPEDMDSIRLFAIAYLRNEQDLDLKAFGIEFDEYYLESSLYSDGKVQAGVDRLVAQGKTYEEGGALWFRSTDYGDDKDRVMRKSEGGYTYFVPDIAYHVTKFERGFAKVINVQGSDHHGTIARVRAGLQAVSLGIPLGFPDYVLHKMVRVIKGGEEVKMSKRSGTGVTLRDLIEWSGDVADLTPEQKTQRGRDAVRFFLLSRKADTEYTFDVDLALARSDENPVYYIQYAHARICSVFTQWGGDVASLSRHGADPATTLERLIAPREFSLLAKLAEFPEMIEAACAELAPHTVAFYLKDLASEVHSYYNAERFLVDDESLKLDRLTLLAAARQVLRNGLSLAGVSAPEKM
jgi:arginyl-tRNA synthetase